MKQKKQKETQDTNPYATLSLLRARRLAGMPVEIPPELIEQAKQYSGDKAAKLWDELESIGIEVREIYDEGKSVYGYKICTPIRCYMGYASKNDIIGLAKHDIKAAANASCPGCNQKINYANMDAAGVMVCPCGSMVGSIPTNLAARAVMLIQRDYGLEGIYTVLRYWDDLYFNDYKTEYDWLLIEKMKFKLKQLPDVAVTIKKPSTSSSNCTKRIPVFGAWEDTDDTTTLEKLYNNFVNGLGSKSHLFSIPCCTHCKYCIEVHEYSYYSNDFNYCVHPVEKSNFIERMGIELSFDDEELQRYQENNEGVIKNAFMNALLSDLIQVDIQTRDLEGKVLSPFNNFQGPICSEFDLDKEHPDLEENRGPFRIVGEVSVAFGIPNTHAIEQERTDRQKMAMLENIIQKARALMQNDPDAEKLFTTRIEMKDMKSAQARSLIQYLASKFTFEELQIVNSYPGLPITTSHKAYAILIQKSIDLTRK